MKNVSKIQLALINGFKVTVRFSWRLLGVLNQLDGKDLNALHAATSSPDPNRNIAMEVHCSYASNHPCPHQFDEEKDINH